MDGMKKAIVTGGAGDIGRAIAKRLAVDGWEVALLDIDGEALQLHLRQV
jgi:NAD(P)-dependent dehydrogenase (short-subunit alcohol dehydrogenase family)